MAVDQWRPHHDFSRFLIPGCPGRAPVEYEIYGAAHKTEPKTSKKTESEAYEKSESGTSKKTESETSDKTKSKKRQRSIFAFKRLPKNAGGVDRESPLRWGCHLLYPLRERYSASGRMRFLDMCAWAAAQLHLVTASGTYKHQDFMRFAAAFASRNPGLWDDFLEEDTESVESIENTGMVVGLWEEVEKDLTVLCKCYDYKKSTIIRASAIWLFKGLDRLRSPGTDPVDPRAKAFFDRFTTGKNVAEAKALPDWKDFTKTFNEKHLGVEWESMDERNGELDLAWETEVMPKWQESRMKILRWPTANRKKVAK